MFSMEISVKHRRTGKFKVLKTLDEFDCFNSHANTKLIVVQESQICLENFKRVLLFFLSMKCQQIFLQVKIDLWFCSVLYYVQ